MKNFIVILAFVCSWIQSSAQESQVVFFTEDGAAFHVSVNGMQVNDVPSTNVKAPIERKGSYHIFLRFADTAKGVVKDQIKFEDGYEYVYLVKLEKSTSLENATKVLANTIFSTKPLSEVKKENEKLTQSTEAYVFQLQSKNKFTAPPPQPVAAKQQQTTSNENLPDQAQYRGSSDPLKGLNVSKPKEMVIGQYYALIIGIDKYKGTWTPLKNAVNDAKAVEGLLKSKYKFDQFKTLYNETANRLAIIKELEWLVKNVKEQDNVFIYYSGHGEFKSELNKGYWVPSDALTQSTGEYISNNDLQTYLGGIRSKHTLLVSDACFSGDIFRGNTVAVPFEESEKYYRDVHHLPSRQAITSGGVEPVMDGGREGHSVFAYYFLKALKENENKFYDASQVYERLKIPVVNNSNQSPKISAIKDSGDEGGQFIFIKK